MCQELIFEGKVFKSYDDHYFVSSDGDVYSMYIKRLMKWDIDHDGYPRIQIHGKPIKVHKLVFIVWGGCDIGSLQINHRDDNKLNPSISNLYLGSQQENIKDCIRNNKRVGHVWKLIVYDREEDKTILFVPANKFVEYCGCSLPNKSVNTMFKRKWVQQRFEILEYTRIESVTTKPDECKVVEGRMTPFEVHHYTPCVEEIV